MTDRATVPDYTRLSFQSQRRRERWKRRVESRTPRLVCQDCGGMGGEIEVIMEGGQGPWVECYWCEGTGYVDGHRRAEWLHYRSMLKKGGTDDSD